MSYKQTQAMRQLERFKRQVKTTPALVRETSRALSFEIRALIEEGFVTKTDPRGRQWAARKNDYPWPTLSKTRRMRRSFSVRSRPGKIVISNPVKYTTFHQTGTRKMAARKMVPDQKFSQKWLHRLNRVVEERFRAHYFG